MTVAIASMFPLVKGFNFVNRGPVMECSSFHNTYKFGRFSQAKCFAALFMVF